jgi:hypothetical protein
MHTLFAQQNCEVKNFAFKSGEQFYYQIQYNWGAVWMNAGEADFKVETEELNGRKVFHFVGTGSTYPKYDWFFKVRDKYESYADTFNLKPIRFKRDVSEGGNHTYDDYVFNHKKNKVYTFEKRNKKPLKTDSLKITECTMDVVTAIFYTRCIDFSKYKPNDTIPVTFVLDGEVVNSYVRYVGKEIIYNAVLGYVECIKFRPKLIEGSLFKGGEGMVVWVTNDKNRMPVYVETPILVGTIKVHLTKYSGHKYPIECFKEKPEVKKKK